MTKDERNNLILIGGASAVAIYLIVKGNKERERREMIRQQQILQAQQNRGGGGRGLANLIGGLGTLFKGRGKKRDKKQGNGVTLPNVDLSSVFGGGSPPAATIGNVSGGGIDLDNPFGSAGTLDTSLTDFNVSDFINQP